MRKAGVRNILVDLQRRVQPRDASIVPQPSSSIPNLIDLEDDDPPSYEVLLPGGILPNPLSNPLLSHRSSTSTAGRDTSNTSFEDTISELEDIFFDFEETQQRGNLQTEWAPVDDHLENTLRSALAIEDDTTPSQIDLDRLTALELQAQLDNEDQQSSSFRDLDRYTRESNQEERMRVMDFSADMETAKRLAHEWEAQDITYEQNLESLQRELAQEDLWWEEQAAFAHAVRRDEEASKNAIRRDQAAAWAAQSQWEQEAREAEDSTRILREQMQREEEEEAERRIVGIEQAKRLLEEFERQEEEERQRLAAEAAEVERRERQADCVVCMEPFDKIEMCLLGCEHYYCEDCIIGRFSSSAFSTGL